MWMKVYREFVPLTEEMSKHLVEDLERIIELNNPLM